MAEREAVEVGAVAWVYAMGRYRTGRVVKITPSYVTVEWSIPGGEPHRRAVKHGFRGWRRAWGVVGVDPMTRHAGDPWPGPRAEG